jgi:serine/threonine protein kinase
MKEIEKEREILESLNHPNVIKLETAFKSSRYLYLMMELCDCDLKTFV